MTSIFRPEQSSHPSRVVSCTVQFQVAESAEVTTQVMASDSAGLVDGEYFEVLSDGHPPISLRTIHNTDGQTMHLITSGPGRLAVKYRAEIRLRGTAVDAGDPRSVDYERQVYLRPSRYCPSDHLIGFAVAEFGDGPKPRERIAAITEWIRKRIEYVPGSSTVHDSAEDTLLTGKGTCRDFAHLGVALCRATGIPARFAAVYAPGLSPMDFHAVYEANEDGRWYVYDSTGLAPRASLVRIATGRDAADTAFAAVTRGNAELESIEVGAVALPDLPSDDLGELIELA
jgi:transglutaminase-like putative cysteine protease